MLVIIIQNREIHILHSEQALIEAKSDAECKAEAELYGVPPQEVERD